MRGRAWATRSTPTLGLHPQARVALVRHGAREGLHGIGPPLERRERPLRAASHGHLSPPARRGRRPPVRRPASRQLHHARLRLPAAPRPRGERRSGEGHPGLSRLLGNLTSLPRAEWLAHYGEGFMRALAVSATPRKHVNVLRHIVGFFKQHLSAADKRELGDLIKDFAEGLVPLVVPIALINHYVARFGVGDVADQIYLSPLPKEL